jgi:FkbM family methyltransferase
LSNGVVHVGAHRGEEVPIYLRDGRSPVICFEPQDLGWMPPSSVQLVRCALGDYSGTLEMRVPHYIDSAELDTQSATAFPEIPERARQLGWTSTPHENITVKIRRFDEWAEESGFLAGSCELLVVDVQGMELQVLFGFGSYLRDFSKLIVECSEKVVFEGGASATEVIHFLSLQGFVRTSPVLDCGDITFVKDK